MTRAHMTPRPIFLNGPVPPITDLPQVGASRPAVPYFNRAQGRRFQAEAAGDVAEIDLFDEIGFWGVTASAFKSELDRVKAKTLRVNLNSPGGDVFDGIAMMNALVQHPARVEVNVMGLAASAASVVAMAGDEVIMAGNAFMMIHNVWIIAMGDRNVLADYADDMAKFDGALARTYAHRTGADIATVKDWMNDETWFSAAEAVDEGFADTALDTDEAPQALFDLSGFKNLPKDLPRLAAAGKGNGTPTKRDMERMLMQDAGLTRSEARQALRGLQQAGTQDAAGNPDTVTPDADLAGFAAAGRRLLETLT